ncbi:hypothetical protein, partial [Aestuariicoccus sp. MJ-SS9]|uniref:hypothetical protein n=1 Tax=Aestuariicoccus sp. MJ-SS9 TaxID=3079855 RepID=UPI00291286AE
PNCSYPTAIMLDSNSESFSRFVQQSPAGHQEALRLAANLGWKKDKHSAEQIEKTLEWIYTIDAFACHFLTDLFSAGHMRTPRKALYEMRSDFARSGYPAQVTGYLAKVMHDEDSKNGLLVTNAKNMEWKAYGDKKLLDTDDRTNDHIAQKAVQASANDIWTAFESHEEPTHYEALSLIPDLGDVENPLNKQNNAALFVPRPDRVVDCRKPMLDTHSYHWDNDWWIEQVVRNFGL